MARLRGSVRIRRAFPTKGDEAVHSEFQALVELAVNHADGEDAGYFAAREDDGLSRMRPATELRRAPPADCWE